MNYCESLSDASTIPSALRITPVQRAQSALSGVMREHMKPSDIDYAQALIKTASQRVLSSEESAWLDNFASWYDTWNNQFWSWYDNKGGREETAALKRSSRVTAPTTGTQERPRSNGTPQTPQQKASSGTTPKTGPTPPTPPTTEQGAKQGTNKGLILYGLGGLVLVTLAYLVIRGKK